MNTLRYFLFILIFCGLTSMASAKGMDDGMSMELCGTPSKVFLNGGRVNFRLSGTATVKTCKSGTCSTIVYPVDMAEIDLELGVFRPDATMFFGTVSSSPCGSGGGAGGGSLRNSIKTLADILKANAVRKVDTYLELILPKLSFNKNGLLKLIGAKVRSVTDSTIRE